MEGTMIRKKSRVWMIFVPVILLLILLGIAVVVFTIFENSADNPVLTQEVSEPLGDATAARFDFNVGTGNMTIDHLPSGERLLYSGTLQYLESQGRPAGTLDRNGRLYTLTLKASGGRQPGFKLPWEVCNGETDWQIHLNPTLPSDLTVYSGGGNVKLDLAGLIVTRLAANTGGGNVNIVLPDRASDLSVTAKTGGGNVTVVVGSELTGSNTLSAASGGGNVAVRLPGGIAARIHADSGMGKLALDPLFIKIDDHTYQSPDYSQAADKIEITAESGAGNVTVSTK